MRQKLDVNDNPASAAAGAKFWVFTAESADVRRAGTTAGTGLEWQFSNDPDLDAGGDTSDILNSGVYQALPDTGVSIGAGAARHQSPSLKYDINLDGATTLYVWVRGIKSRSTDVGVYARAADTTSVQGVSLRSDILTWSTSKATLDFAGSDETLSIDMRHTGSVVDHIIVTDDATYDPANNPAEADSLVLSAAPPKRRPTHMHDEKFVRDVRGNVIQALGVDEDTHVQVQATAAAEVGELEPTAQVVELVASIACHMKFGDENVSADTSSRLVLPGSYIYKLIPGQTHLAVIRAVSESADGVVSVTKIR